MAKEDVLAKVEADLRRGHSHPAMQRLSSLTAAYPDDLDVRAARAALCRQVGNLTEAGRWGFLTEDTGEQEIAAFERAYPVAWTRLRALRLIADPMDRLGPVAKARLSRLTAQAADEPPGPVLWTASGPAPHDPAAPRRDAVWALAIAAALIAVCGLAGLGLVTLVRWVF
ncbi:hypothetical protein Ais01nite_16540 [Asanoa ishikariensis]|uniref:Uncharacterized protein n=1 Tax=Asanoa ishikariensis TaxID=137265 RepID=A0A1H3UI40_9ACTN|nr:DUF6584 family protein [Asanoa ishikariensis]GIF63619.1 hypothetical protein Ais01nite_16540 [Asanoa ishikariensis]SDZ61289.1 hypothetical protein SAMN05421684_7219 [Asanoa ishikariensis]